MMYCWQVCNDRLKPKHTLFRALLSLGDGYRIVHYSWLSGKHTAQCARTLELQLSIQASSVNATSRPRHLHIYALQPLRRLTPAFCTHSMQ